MAVPEPKPGLVIRCDYLWLREASAGRDQGKDRPACLLAAGDSSSRPRFVVILPITHSPPSGDTVGIEIPVKVRRAVGLDDEPCWVIVSGHNVDEWPNAGLDPIPGRPGIFALASFLHACSPRSSASFSIWPARTAARAFAAENSLPHRRRESRRDGLRQRGFRPSVPLRASIAAHAGFGTVRQSARRRSKRSGRACSIALSP